MVELMVELVIWRSCHLSVPPMGIKVGIGAPGGQQQKGINPAPGHRQQGRARPQSGANLADHCLELRGLQTVGPAHEHQVCGFQLILKQIFDRR